MLCTKHSVGIGLQSMYCLCDSQRGALRLSFRQRRAAVLAIARTRRVVRAAARVAAKLPIVLVAESGTRELGCDDAGRHREDPPAQ